MEITNNFKFEITLDCKNKLLHKLNKVYFKEAQYKIFNDIPKEQLSSF